MKKCERKQTYIHIMGDPEEKREREEIPGRNEIYWQRSDSV